MKWLFRIFVSCAVCYLLLHLIVFCLNAGYRSRWENEDYINGESIATYYTTHVWG